MAHHLKTQIARIITVVFVLVSYINFGLYCIKPNLFLINMQVSYTYDVLYNHLTFLSFLHFSSVIPWDNYFSVNPD